jgi:hypothetical protein
MWNSAIPLPSTRWGHGGTTSGAADVDGDGEIEVVALNNSNQIIIMNGLSGTTENTWTVSVGSGQRAGHIVIVNLRGEGERDAIVQTIDADGLEGSSYEFYINRSLIAINLEDGSEIWTLTQDTDTGNGYYEGYWGQAHGGLICADVDDDGLDEVVGGNLVQDDGDTSLFSYNRGWLAQTSNYIDHLDAVAVGDFRPDIPGLEWIVTEEDGLPGSSVNDYWHTVMFNSTQGILWSREAAELFPTKKGYYPFEKDFEPQNIAVGNFDISNSYCEVWNRSRFDNGDSHDQGTGQWPWVYNYNSVSILADYGMSSLPANFNTFKGKGEGLEIIWTIDWEGGDKEYIVGQARHTEENVGIFDAMDLSQVMVTGVDYPSISSYHVYVADIGGDSREELIAYDRSGGSQKLKIYWNASSPSSLNPVKWNDPLYRRVKQTANYYSPGSYTKREPVLLRVKVMLEGPYTQNDSMSFALKTSGYIPTTSPYADDPRIVSSVPDSVVDWILVELRSAADGHGVIKRSCFLRCDGYIITEEQNYIEFFIEEGDYFIVVKHRNHLSVMSKLAQSLSRTLSTYDFTDSEDQYYGSGGTVKMETGVWGMIVGDVNNSGHISASDRIAVRNATGFGYLICDLNFSGHVSASDRIIIRSATGFSQVP